MHAVRDTVSRTVTPRRAAAFLAVLAALVAAVVAESVFPHLSLNHDEGVYLQQAALLLEGQLRLHPPVAESFRPWFFVTGEEGLYPKYTPVTAGIFALGGLFGSYVLALSAVASASIALVYGVVAELFDRWSGVVAGGLVLAAPLFVVESAVFLSYVPTFCLNLCFAWAYLRADRTGDRRFSALAGAAVGLAFFSRPYTAVLFALPFIVHALWTLRGLDRERFLRLGVTAALGLVGVGVTLTYNLVVTGDPTVFPYQAFAPLDGLGFGRRRILAYERVYDVELALRANARVLWAYVTEWSVAAPFGVLLAAAGLTGTLTKTRRSARRLTVAGLFVTIPLGNVYFWGNLNILGNLSDPTEGLITVLGPYYHTGLLLPTAAFGAVALMAAVRRLRGAFTETTGATSYALAVVVLVATLGAGVATVGAVDDPLERNADITRTYDQAYEPFDRSFDDALVYLPTPYGDWLNHPFQRLRNDPGYDGSVVYALQHRQFAVSDTFPDRTLYRYVYRGRWTPQMNRAVEPHLQPIEAKQGSALTLTTTVGLPSYAEGLEVRLSTGENGSSTGASAQAGNLTVETRMANGTVTATSPAFGDAVSTPLEADEPVKLTVFVDYGTLGSFEYVVRLPVDRQGDTYRALTPRLEVCRSPRLCGGEAAYVPGTHREGIRMNATLQTP